MSEDLRQGVTPAGHAVLDAVNRLKDEGIGRFPRDDLLRGAAGAVACAQSFRLDQARICAIKGAAMLILAVELIDEEIAR